MITGESNIEIQFVQEHGIDKVVEYAKSFMKCEVILLQPIKKSRHYNIRGFSSSGYIDVIIDMSGSISADVNEIYRQVEQNIELNSHAKYSGVRVATFEDKVAARIYYEDLVSCGSISRP